MLKYTRFFAEFSLVGFFQPMCMRKFKGCSLGKKNLQILYDFDIEYLVHFTMAKSYLDNGINILLGWNLTIGNCLGHALNKNAIPIRMHL